MNFDFQPQIENELVRIQPLQEGDFESLYKIASDPLLWEQHPNKNRYERPVFENFFAGAMESKGAFLVLDKKTNNVIGTSRFYELNTEEKSVAIGYTFIGRDYWGTGYNKALKHLMINHAFQFLEKIIFHIGATNLRSQIAVGKIGAVKIGEVDMSYVGEPSRHNFVYEICKSDWGKNLI